MVNIDKLKSRRTKALVILILIFYPFLIKGYIFIIGETTQAEVVGHRIVHTRSSSYRRDITFSEIQFKTEDYTYTINGPDNKVYPAGKIFILYYMKHNPKRHVIFNFSFLYLQVYMVFPSLVNLIYFSFVTSFKSNITNSQKRHNRKKMNN